MSNHRFGRALLACALTSTLAAQESGGPFRFVPEDSVLVMKLAGPAAWGEAFADTSLRDLLDGATLGPMLRAADDRLTALLEASDELPFDPVELRATVEGYTGDLLLVVMMDVGSLPDAIENDEAPGLAVGVILSDDGHTDLQTLVDLVTEKVEEENRDGLTDLAIGAHRLRVQVSNDPQASLPQLIDGDVVMLIGSDLEQQAGWFLEAEDHFEPDEMLLQSQLALHLDFSGIIPGFVEAIAELSSGDERQIELLEILGLMSLESLDLTLTADESYLASTIQIRCNDRPRGLLDLYVLGYAFSYRCGLRRPHRGLGHVRRRRADEPRRGRGDGHRDAEGPAEGRPDRSSGRPTDDPARRNTRPFRALRRRHRRTVGHSRRHLHRAVAARWTSVR